MLASFLRFQELYPHLAGLLLCLAKSSLLVGLALLLTGTVSRRSALMRSWAWRAAVVGLLGLAAWEFAPRPIISMAPTLRVGTVPVVVTAPAPVRLVLPAVEPIPVVRRGVEAKARVRTASAVQPDAVLRVVDRNVTAAWMIGFLLLSLGSAGRVLSGFWWLRRSSLPTDARLQGTLREVSDRLGLLRPCRLAFCAGLHTPLLAGWFGPTIFLPEESRTWTEPKLRAVFIHELSHWQRWDQGWQMLANLAACLWWWQPLAWFVLRQVKLEAERAADDNVVLREHDGAAYAQTLVDIAASVSGSYPATGIAMVNRSPLERRIRSLLQENPWRGRQAKLGIGITFALLSLFLIMGGLRVRSADVAAPTPTISTAPTGARLTARRRVVNQQGQPIAGAHVEVYLDMTSGKRPRTTSPAAGHKPTETGKDGIFTYSVPGYKEMVALVIARGYARKFVTVPYDGKLEDVVLGPGIDVSGQVLKDGKPVPGVEVGIFRVQPGYGPSLSDNESGWNQIVAETDQAGRYTLWDLDPDASYAVHVKRASLGTMGVATDVEVDTYGWRGPATARDLVVEPGIMVTGRMTLPDGSTPTPRQTMTLHDGSTEEVPSQVELNIHHEGAYDQQTLVLDPDLHFSFLARDDKEVRISAYIEGYRLRDAHEAVTALVTRGHASIDLVCVPYKIPVPKPPDLPFQIPVTPKVALAFREGDGIEVQELKGEKEKLQVGGVYRITGVCRLASLPKATVYLGNATSPADDAKELASTQIAAWNSSLFHLVTKGSTAFECTFTPYEPGALHLTLYEGEVQHADGNTPYAEIYLGEVLPQP